MDIRKKTRELGGTAAGKAREAIGKTKETTGKSRGDARLEHKGRTEKAMGKVKQAVEKGRHSLKH
ncbi:CsbD family protein [Streptomyces sp. NPDC021749]|uniref:CsbD family protein n=1 Tax=Streptomyces sp. NPDC021749 TaxID=3154905 RepID=UPI0033CE28E0